MATPSPPTSNPLNIRVGVHEEVRAVGPAPPQLDLTLEPSRMYGSLSMADSTAHRGSREDSGVSARSVDSMRPPTTTYGGCEASPMGAYQRVDVVPESDPRTSSYNSKSATSHRKFNCLFDTTGAKNGRPHTLVLRFDPTGSATFQEMSRLDVLHMAQNAAKPKAPPSDKPDADDATATAEGDDDVAEEIRPARIVPSKRRLSRRMSPNVLMDLAKVVDVQPVHARDIRKLDSAFAVSNEASVVVRKQAILMNADPLRAVIMRDVCLVFVPDGADSLLTILKDKFREHTFADSSDLVPFELVALEALLATICRYFESDFEKIIPVVASALDRLAHGRISTAELETLRGFKNTMTEFESQVDGVRRALMEILDDEEGLRLLHLTKLHNEPALLGDLYSFDSEQVEVLIENYLQDIFSTRRKINLFQHRIQNTESLVMLKLDSMRNYLLGVDLIFSLVAISIAVGTYVTGAFGMNLDSKLQTTAGWFWGVFIFTALASVSLTTIGVLFFRRKGVLI